MTGVDVVALRDALRVHHPIMRSETGPLSGCRCGGVKLGEDVIQHVVSEISQAHAAKLTVAPAGVDVPAEWVEAAWIAVRAGGYCDPDFSTLHDQARWAVEGAMPLVLAERNRAIRDALDEVVRRIEAVTNAHGGIGDGLAMAQRIVAELRGECAA